jgi:pilus assembly protein FimV
MQFTHRPPVLFALKTLSAAVASAVFLSSAANAAGLGKLTVLSALGQPLRAEIELTAVSGDEASGLSAKLAAPDAFKAANIDFNPALLSLRFNVERKSGHQIIRISSTQPLNEPFVDMLLELSWNNGRLVREYTFLLDPPELRATQTAQAAAPVAVPSQRPVQSAPAPAPAQRQAEQPPAPPSHAKASATQYRVKPGDSLSRIAEELKPVDISLDMMLVALYRANPDAFIGNNMNRLKSGRILSVPEADQIRSIDEGEAHGIVVAHAADFNAYRNKLAGQVAAAAPARAPQAGRSAAGKITAKVEEHPTAANEAQDRLRLSKATGPGAGGKGSTSSTEDVIAKEKELADAQARVKELEKNVGNLEKLMSVKSKAGTEAAGNAKQESAPPAAKPTPIKPANKHVPAPKKPAPPPEPTLFDTISDNITYIAAAAAVLLLGALGVAQRRKKKTEPKKSGSEPSILGVPNDQAKALFAETGGQSVDTNNSVFNSSFAPSASQLDTNEVDPVAEADVYIAYGRDAQAEEILKEALRTHPERYPVRLKLLEIYAARKDQRAFETQAGDLYSLTRGQGDEWEQAAALGRSFDPLNPLYANAGQASTHAGDEERAPQAALAQQLEQAFRAEPPADLADNAPTAQPEPAAASPAEAPGGSADDHVLDFDLGGLSFEPVAAPEPAPAPAATEAAPDKPVQDMAFEMEPFEPLSAPAAPAASAAPAEPAKDEGFDLAFDMDFDKPAAATPATEPEKADDGLALDLSLENPSAGIDIADLANEFDLPPVPSATEAAAAPEDSAPATELKDPLFDLDTMDFGLAPAPAPAPAAQESTPELKDPLFDLDTFGLDVPAAPAAPAQPVQEDDPFALPEPAKAAHEQLPGFDMSDIDLELPAASQAPAPQPEPEMVGAESSAAHMEMETKLDLALAYQEIGDKEGARELLDEVIKGGNSDQVSKATAMRAKLA